MERRSAIINLVTVIFVAGSLYFMFKHNADIPAVVKHDLQNETEPAIIDATATSPSLSKKETTTPIAPVVVTPGPLVSSPSSSRVSASPSIGGLTVSGIISETNDERTARSLSSLKESKQLDASAQVKANDILVRQYFEHTAPDGATVSTLVDAQGYAYIRIGENLALGDFKNDQAVVTAWMNSPGHRANILGASYQDIGVGIAQGYYKGLKVVVAVQHFGTPLTACPQIESGLRQQITDGQARLAKISSSLSALKAEIDAEKGSGETDVNGLIDSYNAGVDSYNADYAAVEKIRTKYNAEVDSFDACVSALK